MAKTLQFRDGSEDGPTGKFLLAVTHEAHRQLAPDQAEGVVAEVRDHLGMQVEMQVMNGTARAVAERDAVQGFGSARHFVRGVSHSLHDTRRAERARTVTLAVTTLTLAVLFFYNSRFVQSQWVNRGNQAENGYPLYWLLLVPVLAIVAGSWAGWRALPRHYAALGAAFVLMVTLWTGFDTVTLSAKPDSRAPWLPTYSRNYSRYYMRKAEAATTLRRDMAAEDVQKLQAGLDAFGIKKTHSLRMAGGTIQLSGGRVFQIGNFNSETTDVVEKQLWVQEARLQQWRAQSLAELDAIRRRSPELAQSLLAQAQARNAQLEAQLALLNARKEAAHIMYQVGYTNAPAATAAVKAFRSSAGYQVPRTFIPYRSLESAFVSVPDDKARRGGYQSAASYARQYQQTVGETAPVYKATFGEAQLRWATDGRRWLWLRKEELANQERALETIARVQTAPFGFNIATVWLLLAHSPLLLLPLALVLLNYVPAFLARQTRRAWDGWVWRIRSTT